MKITLAAERWQDLISTEWGGHLRAGGRVSSIHDRSIYGPVGAGTYLDGETDFRLKNKTWAGEIYSFEWHYEAVWKGGDTLKKNNALKNVGGSAAGNALIAPAFISDQTSFLNLSGVIDESTEYIAYHRLDRLVLAAQPTWGTAAVGRQVLTWGNGLVFNPMDLFNPFRPADMERDYKSGADMALLQVQGMKIDDIQMAYVPRRDPRTDAVSGEYASLAGKLHHAYEAFAIDLMAGRHYADTVAGFGATRTVGGAVWRLDLTWTRLGHRQAGSDFLTCVTNLDYAWTWGGKNVYGLLEYYHNGLGKNDYAAVFSDLAMLDRLGRGELFTLGRNYLAGQLQYEIHPLVILSLAMINNLADPSGTIQPRMEWNAAQNIQVVLSGTTHYGREGTEYGGFYVPQYGLWHLPADSVSGRVSLFF
ncbi:MAG: hypothetical protein GY697_14385 [Desulfobacterales bacterium]|nr:hypothetical protein [Desulfobacterales bacterium]